jgi:H+/Cl- antiporter ClcA
MFLIDSRRLRRYRRLPLLSLRLWRRRITIWVGALLVALVAIAFAGAADRAGGLFLWGAHASPILAMVVPPAGLALSVWLTRNFFPGAQGSGIPQVIAALHMSEPRMVNAVLSPRIAVGKVILTLLGLASGASIGREGPTVQVGASIMNSLAGRLQLPRQEVQRAMVLAGGAAGVSAAFNTPLAGIVFAIEELSHSFEARTSGTVLTAVIIGWLAVLVCAICGGALGGLFSRLLVEAAKGFRGRAGRWVIAYPIGFAALCGILLAVIGLVSGGTTYGTGYAQARSLVEGHASLPWDFFVLKFAATVISYLSGIPGGIFAPSLAVGSGLGQLLAPLLPAAPSAAVVLVGLVASFSGAVQAPITATVIVMEMTDNQAMTIPLMATAMLAFGVSRLVCRRPLYGALARRLLVAMERS